jgi:hypothetical protein
LARKLQRRHRPICPPPPEGLTREETRSVAQRKRLRAAVVYEIIRVEGEGELARSFGALWWSALAAGLSIGFSVLAQGMLKAYLPNTPGATIVENLGYSVGFLIVILSRQQLFTENTLTVVLPVIARKGWKWLPACSGYGASCWRPISSAASCSRPSSLIRERSRRKSPTASRRLAPS